MVSTDSIRALATLFLFLGRSTLAAPAESTRLVTATVIPIPASTAPPGPPFSCHYAADPSGHGGWCPKAGAEGWCHCNDSSTYAVTSGPNPCPYTATPPAGPTTIPTTDCDAPPAPTPEPPATSDDSDRTECSPEACDKFCTPHEDHGKLKRSLSNQHGSTSGTVDLEKRFLEEEDPDEFPYELLRQDSTENICDEKGDSYFWKKLKDSNDDYAAALEGLCGCTVIYVASSKGVFSSHLFEKPSLLSKNYKNTITEFKGQLSPHKKDLSAGEAFLIIPTKPRSNSDLLYSKEIVDALNQAILDASGIEATQKTYTPLDCKKSPQLGENSRGTFSFEFDPKYKKDDKTTRAYRIIGEGKTFSFKTDL